MQRYFQEKKPFETYSRKNLPHVAILQKLVFNPANQKVVDFLDELQKLAKDAFGIAAHAIIEQFIYAKCHHTWKNQ